MTTYQPGEHVKVTIEGVIHEAVNAFPRRILLWVGAHAEPVSIPHGERGVTVERVAPAEWPPQPGDLWRDRDGDVWSTAQDGTSYRMTGPFGREDAPGDLLAGWGPLTLVHREPPGASSEVRA